MTHKASHCLILATCFGLALLAAANLGAQPVPDLFQELESTTPATPESSSQADANWLDEFIAHTNGELRLRSVYYTHDVDSSDTVTEDRNLYSEARLKLATWIGRDDWRFDVSGWLETGDSDEAWDGVSEWLQDRDRDRRYLQANEAYLTLLGEDYQLTLGKKIFSDGLSTLYSPANRYSPLDMNDPIDSRRLGVWQASLDWYWHDLTFTTAVLPVVEWIKVPYSSSRWYGSGMDFDFRYEDAEQYAYPGASEDITVANKLNDWLQTNSLDVQDLDVDTSLGTVNIVDDTPSVSAENTNLFLRAKGHLNGTDWFASAYYGYSPYVVLQAEQVGNTVTLYKKLVQVASLSSGFSTTFKQWEFHVEGTYSHACAGKDDSYLSYVLGTTYRFGTLAEKLSLNRLLLTLEYAGEWETQEQSADDYVISSSEMRLGQNEVLARLECGFSDTTALSALVLSDMKRHGQLYRLQADYRWRNRLTFSAAVEIFQGDSQSYYGYWDNNDRLITSVTYAF
jgi:hypothetical protein